MSKMFKIEFDNGGYIEITFSYQDNEIRIRGFPNALTISPEAANTIRVGLDE